MKLFTQMQRIALSGALLCSFFGGMLFAQGANVDYSLLSSHSFGDDYDVYKVSIGTASEPETNVLSLSFSFEYEYPDGSVEMDLGNSWLNQNGTCVSSHSYDAASNEVTVTIDRVTGGAATGYGEIGLLVLDKGGIVNNLDVRRLALDLSLVELERGEAKLDVFPVPAEDQLNIYSGNEIGRSTLYSLSGRVVKERRGSGRLDVADLPAGVYQLRVETAKGLVSKRVRID